MSESSEHVPGAASDAPDVGGAQKSQPSTSPRPRTIVQSLGSIVVGFEIIVVFLASLVIWGLAASGDAGLGGVGVAPWAALVVGGFVIAGLVVTIWALRFRWGVALGWTLQVVIVASGFLNPAMFVVGALFGGMWWYCMIVGARIDRNGANAPRKEVS